LKKGKITVLKNGPYLVSGSLPLGKEISEVGKEGEPERWVKGAQYPDRKDYALCRCGQSKTKPFCDGAHDSIGFDGTETASRKPYAEQAEKLEGPAIDMMDAESLCAGARFCHGKGNIWNLVSSSGDAELKKEVIKEACNCPSGRLVAYDKKTGKPIESTYTPSISLIEDPQAKSSGPIWVKGGVMVVSENGHVCETRNRITLCRCGRSSNKPMCDGSHISIRFNDGDESLKK
jgi:CDGSH-type Zn-finger protein